MVTMYNKETGVTVHGINIAYIGAWTAMGFEVIDYNSKNIILLQKAG